ncbi:MAG: hypothetical protein V3V15_02715 [Sphingorhabdus sp.]
MTDTPNIPDEAETRTSLSVIPAKAGIHFLNLRLDGTMGNGLPIKSGVTNILRVVL